MRPDDVAEATPLARSLAGEETASALLDAIEHTGATGFCVRDADGLTGIVSVVLWPASTGASLAWIAGPLVAPRAQGQDVGRALLRSAVAAARAEGAGTIGADVTVEARALFEAEGFAARGDVARWSRAGAARAAPALPSSDHAIYPVSAAEMMELAAYDRVGFGANRAPLLAHLMSRAPQFAFVAIHRKTGLFSGVALGSASGIGPLVADSPAAAAWLLHACETAGAPPRASVAEWNSAATSLFESAGYVRGTRLTRMTHAGAPLPGRPDTIYAVGPASMG